MEENYFYIRNYKNILEIIKDADYTRPFNLYKTKGETP